MGKQTGIQPFPGKRTSMACNSDLERQRSYSQHLPLLLHLPVVFTNHDAMWYGITLQCFEVSCPVCVPPHLLVSHHLLCWWGNMRNKKLTLCKNCSAVAKTSLFYQYCFHYKSRSQKLLGIK